MINIKDTVSAILNFEEAAAKHADATEKGDYKTANKNYAIIAKVILFLKEKNEILKITELLTHSSVGVRLWAATYLLPISESQGLSVLKQIASEDGIHSLTAKTTASEWEEGNLNL